MSEMIERVAIAIQDALIAKSSAESSLMGVARAAVEAMREPTEAMEQAGLLANEFTNPRPCGRFCISRATLPASKPYEAMIDAALKE